MIEAMATPVSGARGHQGRMISMRGASLTKKFGTCPVRSNPTTHGTCSRSAPSSCRLRTNAPAA